MVNPVVIKVAEKLARKAGWYLWRWSYRRAVARQRLRDLRPSDDLDDGDDKPVIRAADD